MGKFAYTTDGSRLSVVRSDNPLELYQAVFEDATMRMCTFKYHPQLFTLLHRDQVVRFDFHVSSELYLGPWSSPQPTLTVSVMFHHTLKALGMVDDQV